MYFEQYLADVRLDNLIGTPKATQTLDPDRWDFEPTLEDYADHSERREHGSGGNGEGEALEEAESFWNRNSPRNVGRNLLTEPEMRGARRDDSNPVRTGEQPKSGEGFAGVDDFEPTPDDRARIDALRFKKAAGGESEDLGASNDASEMEDAASFWGRARW